MTVVTPGFQSIEEVILPFNATCDSKVNAVKSFIRIMNKKKAWGKSKTKRNTNKVRKTMHKK